MRRKTRLLAIFMFCLGLTILAGDARAWEAEMDWSRKAFGNGEHCAFTDLAYWKDAYYLCFRVGASHGSMDGEIQILRSTDLETWTPCGRLKTMGDDRDPHFTVTPERLYVYFGVWDLTHRSGHQTPDRNNIRSHMAYTTDGADWSAVKAIYEPGWWVWRVRHDGDAFHGVAYTALRPKPDEREARLLRSEDGLNWAFVSTMGKTRGVSESDLVFENDRSIWTVTRTREDAVILRSDPSRKTWSMTDTGAMIHAPALAKVDETWFVAGRDQQDGDSRTSLWVLDEDQAHHLLTLPSGGDTSYPGLLLDPQTGESPALLMSWYSQHEDEGRAASVYVARIKLRNAGTDKE